MRTTLFFLLSKIDILQLKSFNLRQTAAMILNDQPEAALRNGQVTAASILAGEYGHWQGLLPLSWTFMRNGLARFPPWDLWTNVSEKRTTGRLLVFSCCSQWFLRVHSRISKVAIENGRNCRLWWFTIEHGDFAEFSIAMLKNIRVHFLNIIPTYRWCH